MGEPCKAGTDRDIAEKVFLLAFVYPGEYNIYQMDDVIFGEKCNRSYRAIKKMGCEEGDGCIYREPANREGRNEKLVYVNFESIIEGVKNKANSQYDEYPALYESDYPDEFDWYVLEDKLTSRIFKHFLETGLFKQKLVNGIIKKISEPTPGFSAMEYILERFDHLLILREQNPALKRLSEGMENKEQYDAELKKMKQKIKTLKRKKLFPNIGEDFFGLSYDLLEEYILFYRFPKETINKFKWLSEFGSMYYQMEPYLQKATAEIDIDFLLS